MALSPMGTTGGRRGVIVAAVVTVVLLVVGGIALFLGFRGEGGLGGAHDAPPAPPAVAASTSGTAPGPTTSRSAPATATSAVPPTDSSEAAADPALGEFLPASQPTALKISSIGLRSDTFVDLTVQRDGTLSVPGTEDEVGLYQAGPTPGQLGPAVLGAHVDSPEGRKGIFWNLGKVQRGDTVAVTRKDGSTASFTVDRVKAYPKAEFPTDLVYKGDFTRSEIRLVTCGGPVDSQNEYRDNVVVFGHLTSTT